MTNRRAESSWLADTGGEFTRGEAIAASLTATFPVRAWRRAVGFGAALAFVAALSALLRRPGAPYAFGLLLCLALLPIFSAPFASRFARRAKMLWLASGRSRRELFAATERELWLRHAPALLLVVLSMAMLLLLAYDMRPALLGRVLLLWVTGMPYGVYLGLAAVRGHLLEYVAAALFVVTVAIGAWAALGQPPRYDWLAAVGTLQLATAAGLRAFAVFRWREIDWIAFRPLRSPLQGLRGA
ncbi:MAG TPA: hypothetical protein VFV10_09310 [Gammaproteobacteria bacterium]|nr:hypothetical protein [Gammaproteobacteria bacterium]